MAVTEPPISDADSPAAVLARLRWRVRGAWAVLALERTARAFWPALTLAFALWAAFLLGADRGLPGDWARMVQVLCALAVLGLTMRGVWRMRPPTRADAVARLDAALPGRPLAALADTQAIGAADPASVALWRAHLARMARAATSARLPAPDLRLAPADPYGLRLAALTALAVALIFGTPRGFDELASGPGAAIGAVPPGPSWEGWVRPPAYTARPALYLNDIPGGALDLPQGSEVVLRLYGNDGALAVRETVSGAPAASPDTPPQGADFTVQQAGQIAIDGPGARIWQIALVPDAVPQIAPDGMLERGEAGQMELPFRATDDYAVASGRAEITLDLAAVDRRHGLTPPPQPRAPIVLDLPMPYSGDRALVRAVLAEDLSKHPWANLPVQVRLSATDALGQTGTAAPLVADLPGRRFFDPLAAAVIEARRDLLWTTENGARTAQVLRAVTHLPDGFIRNDTAALRLRVALRDLEAATAAGLSPEVRDALAETLWQIAELIETGDLASALERLRRAQDRLDEAIRNGADPAEINELMNELRQALDDYMRQLAQEAQRNPDGQAGQDMQGMQMTGNQLQEMLDRLQQLMEEGRMDEAAELMEMLRQLMENMQMQQGQGGQGQGSPDQQALRDLGQALRDQQDLSDDSFESLQDGQQGQTGDLANRQGDLQRELERLEQGPLPGEGSEAGERGRQSLDRANRAMREAERALREGDTPGALDRQAEALEALREGLRDLGEAMAEDQRAQQGQDGQDMGQADPNGARDPLGRTPGESGRLGTDDTMLGAEDTQRRAEELLEELRRRSGEQLRPEEELDYLRRLLERF